MRRSFCISSLVLSLTVATARAQAPTIQPDYDLAYALATASYCAYTVNELDDDRGHDRAIACLSEAANGRPALEWIAVKSPDDVEAYFDPRKPEDGYLLINSQKGVILAFRGTLTPPISPSGSGSVSGAFEKAFAVYETKAVSGLKHFALDWLNNFHAMARDGREAGFNNSWLNLCEHLSRSCRTSSGPGGGNHLADFLKRAKGTGHEQSVFITGHSKGGALATLAALDLPDALGPGIPITIYTFEAPKAVTADFFASASDAERTRLNAIWRFEFKTDLVPLAPVDSSAHFLTPLLPAYSPVGSLVFIEDQKPAEVSIASGDHPGAHGNDAGKLADFAKALLNMRIEPSLNGIITLAAQFHDLGEDKCRQLIDNHFSIFAALEQLAALKDLKERGTAVIRASTFPRSFFAKGLPDEKGAVLWGYRQWCDILIH